MASGDIALRLLISGSADVAISAINSLGRMVSGIFSGMGGAIGNLSLGFQNLGTAGTVGLDAIKVGITGLASSFLAMGAIAGVVLVAVSLGLGVMAVKAAGDFQQGLNRLITGAGDTTDNMQKMGQSILGVSTQTGLLTSGTDGLNAAMYQIISSGQRGSQAINTLSVSAMGAQIEQAKLVDVSKALTTAMTDYGTKQFSATQFMNGYTVAVQRGKITLEELSNTMGPLLPLAKNYGISFSDIAGAMSTMTNAGIPAARAATSLRFMMASIENPTAKAEKAMKSFGLSSVGVANEMKTSLPGALQMVYNAALKAGPEGSVPFNRAISDMIGGSRSLQAYLALTGTHMKDFGSNAAAVAAAMKSSSGGVLGWQTALSNMNVQVERAKAMLAALMITLGTQLMPVFQQLMSVLLPLIAGFLQWVISSGIVKNVLQGLVNAITFLVNVGTTLVNFFKNNEVAMAALKAVLITVALIITTVVVVALIIWAAAAWTAAVANIAAFWPIYLVILIIVVVIALVILAIQHWGQIMSFIGGIFSWLGSVAHTVVTAIGGWFSWLGSTVHGIWDAIRTAIGNFFSMIGTIAHNGLLAIGNFFINTWNNIRNGVGNFFSGLGTIVHNGLTAIGQFFINVFQTIGGWFTWLYNHNYYIKALCDAIKSFFQAAITWLQNAWQTVVTWLANAWAWISEAATITWNAITSTIKTAVTTVGSWIQNAWNTVVSWLTNLWNGVKGIASTAWNAVSNAVMGVVNTVTGWLRNTWTTAVNTVGNIWNTMKGFATTAWNNVTSAFSAAWGAISGVLSGLWNNISNWFSNLANQAIQWGKNVIQNLINGITSMLGALGNAVANAASAIASKLGFHSPTKEGPGSTADKWAPALMDMFASGMIAGIPKVANASLQVANALAFATNPQIGSAGIAVRGGSLGMNNQSTIVVQIQPGDINIDKRKLGDVMFNHQATELRRQGTIRSR